jgi:hypothetical protein
MSAKATGRLFFRLAPCARSRETMSGSHISSANFIDTSATLAPCLKSSSARSGRRRLTA